MARPLRKAQKRLHQRSNIEFLNDPAVLPLGTYSKGFKILEQNLIFHISSSIVHNGQKAASNPTVDVIR